MRKKIASSITLTMLLVGILALALKVEPIKAVPKTIYVDAKNIGDPFEDGSQEHPFDRIQEGVDVADLGDTVFVYNGTYHEFNIMIDTPLTLVGESPDITIIDGSMVDADIIRVMYADNVVVTGFTIQWGGGALSGIILTHCDNNTITGNKLTNNRGYSIYLSNSNMNIISDNVIANCQYGIKLYQSSNNSIIGNEITNIGYGIDLEDSSDNNAMGNTITDCADGVLLSMHTYYNSILGNNITGNDSGIYLDGYSNNVISGNSITNNQCGILLWGRSTNNTVSGNDIADNEGGIFVLRSNNTISDNNIINNTWGIRFFESSSENMIYHNSLVNNTLQVSWSEFAPVPRLPNLWDNGYPSCGNYWSNYTGLDEKGGSDQDEPGSDGIGDIPHIIEENNRDNYPLMKPWGLIETVFNVTWDGESYPVTIISNSSITDFNFSQPLNQISFNVTGPTGTTGFCNMTIPKELGDTFEILVDGVPVSYTQTENATHYFLYFTYQHSIHTITITIRPALMIATIDINPDTLNLKSKGQWITAYIELPEGYDASDIDISTIMLNDTIPAELYPAGLGDYDNDGVLDLMVKFDRQTVIVLLSVGEATLTITLEVNSTPFEGSDTIRVIDG